jgi:hypothetical protein
MKKNRWCYVTYLIYIVFWEALAFGPIMYAVFFKGRSGWWFLLAMFLSASALQPWSWHSLVTGNKPRED